VFTPAEERQAVGGNRKPRIRQAAQQLPILRVQVNIVDLITLLADEVLVLCHERIEVLGATEGQDLQFTVADELLEVPVNRSQTDTRQLRADL
jgi:hypothetical protein